MTQYVMLKMEFVYQAVALDGKDFVAMTVDFN